MKMKGSGLVLAFVRLVLLVVTLPIMSAQRAVIMNTMAIAGQPHTFTCMLEGSDPSIQLSYVWSFDNRMLETGANPQYTINVVVLTDARSDYRCAVRRSDDNNLIAMSPNTSLNVSIPSSAIRLVGSTSSREPSIGSNFSYECRVVHFLSDPADVGVDISISGPNVQENSDRVHIGNISVSGISFERTLEIRPLSAGDTGNYHCTGTVLSATRNPLVIGQTEMRSDTITVYRPMINIDVTSMDDRYLDIAPYNSLSLTCMASLTVRGRGVNLNMVFSWQYDNGTSPYVIPTKFFTGSHQFDSRGISILSLNSTEVGDHTYTCLVSLDVSPATDIINNSESRTITIIGPSSPSMPMNLTTPTSSLFHNRATVQWHVLSVTYDPESYVVQYGLSEANLSLNSTLGIIDTDITLTDFIREVELTDLMVNTTYFYRVVSSNSVGTNTSIISSFTTTDLPPSPPVNLVARSDPTTRTTYTFSWNEPSTSNGELQAYVLTCQRIIPRDQNTSPLTRTIRDPLETQVTVILTYKVFYSCSVQARNMAALSDPSNFVNVTIMETAPGVVRCNERWTPLTMGGGVQVSVSWQPPVQENGITLSYYLQFQTYDGSQVLFNTSVPASHNNFTFSGFTDMLSDGIPYNVSIVAENSVARGSEVCNLVGFSNQLTPPEVRDLHVTRSVSGEEIAVKWTVPSLMDAKGFLVYIVSFDSSMSGSEGRRKRQDRMTCSQSPCMVLVEKGGVNITGLDPAIEYMVSVRPHNEEQENGPASNMTVGSVIEKPLPFPIIAVVVPVVVVLLIIIVVVVIIIVSIMCCNRRKSMQSYEYGVKPSPLMNDTVELEQKKRDYVNDTELTSDQPPVYALTGTTRTAPLDVRYFSNHVKKMHEERDKKFEEEYESLGNDVLASCEIAKINKAKNRFANIFPYDFSRVQLELVDGTEGSDYINASYIDGNKHSNAYIAAQGPMPNTIGDFWRMIWEHKLNTVVMLTKVNEAGKRKCEHYWPENVGDVKQVPETTLKVTFKELLPFADYEIRKFEVIDVSNECSEGPLLVTHYQFLGWPDHGVPKFATSLIEFIRRVRNNYLPGRPILVHCSAGVGRTGTYITLDAMLERMKEDSTINVYQFVRNMRAKRVCMVQTQPQYMFIHDALEELITCGETAIRAPELRSAINALSTVDPDTANTAFEDQFKLLNEVSRVPNDCDISDALQHYNEHKNRFQDKVPYNTNRIRLRPTANQGGEYINASFIDGYKHRNAYIAAQAPLKTTVDDFWRMIWEFKSKVVVMLCPLEEDGKEASHPYWPKEKEDEMTFGKLLVSLQSERDEEDFTERKIHIKEEKAEGTPGQGFIVTQFHYKHWPEEDRPPNTMSLLQMIKILNNMQRNTGNKPITVMCNDGVGRTGSFICIHAMLERVNTENILDFFQFIKSSRIHRPGLVLSLEHYRFCHDTLADYTDSLDSYANFKDLS